MTSYDEILTALVDAKSKLTDAMARSQQAQHDCAECRAQVVRLTRAIADTATSELRSLTGAEVKTKTKRTRNLSPEGRQRLREVCRANITAYWARRRAAAAASVQ